MTSRRTIGLLTLAALLLGVLLHVGQAVGIAPEMMPTVGDVPNGCDRDSICTRAPCPAGCPSTAATLAPSPILSPPPRRHRWIASSDARGSGRRLVPEPRPPNLRHLG